jgi:hypothetical protein
VAAQRFRHIEGDGRKPSIKVFALTQPSRTIKYTCGFEPDPNCDWVKCRAVHSPAIATFDPFPETSITKKRWRKLCSLVVEVLLCNQ